MQMKVPSESFPLKTGAEQAILRPKCAFMPKKKAQIKVPSGVLAQKKGAR
jgi:hypothetical protein